MDEAVFFRLLEVPVDDKGKELLSGITRLNHNNHSEILIFAAPTNFHKIPGAPFAYWAPASILDKFTEHPPAEGNLATIRLGLTTNYDFRFLRLFWEVDCKIIGTDWIPFAKGGEFSPYYFDVHLVLEWKNNGEKLRAFCIERGDTPSRNIRSEDHYFRPGLTWPRRTIKGLNLRALPAGCIFADKGPAMFTDSDHDSDLLIILGVTNSLGFKTLVHLQMAVGSWEVGVLQRTPVPGHQPAIDSDLILEAYNLTRNNDKIDETTHAFRLAGLAEERGSNLQSSAIDLELKAHVSLARLSVLQDHLDVLVFDLYNFSQTDRIWARSQINHPNLDAILDENDEDEEQERLPEDIPTKVQNLFMWCVGVAFGRWDVRFAIDPDLLPDLQGPFDQLPRCAPGALVGTDGLPATPDNITGEAWLAARENVLHIPDLPLPDGATATISTDKYPLPIAWDGILVDDPTHPADIVQRVRQVLTLLYGDRAGVIEKEACDILGVKRLRDYFRDPRKGFFPFHIKRYSKSRRKAPIYWLLQSANRNYAVWLYYHRLDDSTYFTAARDYADTKVNLETARLAELRQGLAALSGSTLKQRERVIEKQQKLVDEVTTFRNTLDKIALRRLPLDHNDGVIISIAPLHELVPWKDAQNMWQELLAGEYEWSTMSQQMKARGLL